MTRRAPFSIVLTRVLVCALCMLAAGVPSRGARRVATDAARPQLVLQLGHSGWVWAADYSPDGRFVLTAGDDHRVILWDVATGVEVRRFETKDQIMGVRVAPDGKHVAATIANVGALIWDVASGRETARFKAPFARSVDFSPDGRFLLTAGASPFLEHNVAIVWDLRTGAEVRRFASNPKMLMFARFSPDGRQVLVGGFDHSVALWVAATGTPLRAMAGHTAPVRSGAFSPDGRYAATVGDDRVARLWDLRTGGEVRRFDGHEKETLSVAFSRDGTRLLTGSHDETARLWDARTGAELWRSTDAGNSVYAVAFSPDGRGFLVAAGITIFLRQADGAAEVKRLQGASPGVYSVSISPDGRFLAAAVGRTPRVWDLAKGVEAFQLAGHEGRVYVSKHSPDGSLLLTSSADKTVRVWDASTGRELRRVGDHATAPDVAVWSPDGRSILTASRSETFARVWDAGSGRELARFQQRPAERIFGAAWSPDGRRIATSSDAKAAYVWDAATGKEVTRLEDSNGFANLAFTPDGRRLLVSQVGGVSAWDIGTNRILEQFTRDEYSYVSSFAFSPDGRRLLTGSGYEFQQSQPGTAFFWDFAEGRQLAPLRGHADVVGDVAYAPDGSYAATASRDGTVRLWDPETGRERSRLVSFRDGSWAVVDPEGRFDTNNLDQAGGVYWVVPDDPLTPLPLEVFLRDYYEPRLLARVLAGERFQPVRDIGSLERIRPSVTIADVRPGATPDTVSVSVEVAAGGPRRSVGAFDLKLFRDGQLVGTAPERGGEVALDATTRKSVVTFPSVRLPTGVETVELSAYAFNRDRIKSATDRRTHRVPPGSGAPRRRAYVVSVGVNSHDDPTLDLAFAADDAREMAAAVAERLARSGQFETCAAVAIVSDASGERLATKANIRAVIDLLAGRPVDAALVASLPGAASLRAARPDDLVVVSFAGHGYADGRGGFYLVPTDVGAEARERIRAVGDARGLALGASPGGARDDVLSRCVSSDELALWMRDVDAGEMAMIVDACQAAAFTGENFKPGPMGSRGLGQLAYDKRMRILAATQADNVALEIRNLRHGLVTYTLLNEGLAAGRADFRPKDSAILLSEWLAYAVDRVPPLFLEIKRGRVQALGTEAPRILVHGDAAPAPAGRAERPAQQPSLFDFSRNRADVVLATLR